MMKSSRLALSVVITAQLATACSDTLVVDRGSPSDSGPQGTGGSLSDSGVQGTGGTQDDASNEFEFAVDHSSLGEVPPGCEIDPIAMDFAWTADVPAVDDARLIAHGDERVTLFGLTKSSADATVHSGLLIQTHTAGGQMERRTDPLPPSSYRLHAALGPTGAVVMLSDEKSLTFEARIFDSEAKLVATPHAGITGSVNDFLLDAAGRLFILAPTLAVYSPAGALELAAELPSVPSDQDRIAVTETGAVAILAPESPSEWLPNPTKDIGLELTINGLSGLGANTDAWTLLGLAPWAQGVVFFGREEVTALDTMTPNHVLIVSAVTQLDEAANLYWQGRRSTSPGAARAAVGPDAEVYLTWQVERSSGDKLVIVNEISIPVDPNNLLLHPVLCRSYQRAGTAISDVAVSPSSALTLLVDGQVARLKR